jgi:hypothetical protein
MKQVHVLGHDYILEYRKSPKLNGVVVRGSCNVEKQKITICTTLTHDQHGEVFLHETFHAISDAMGLDLSEEAITALGCGSWAVFKNNPEILELLARLAVTQPQNLEAERKVSVSGSKSKAGSRGIAASQQRKTKRRIV